MSSTTNHQDSHSIQAQNENNKLGQGEGGEGGEGGEWRDEGGERELCFTASRGNKCHEAERKSKKKSLEGKEADLVRRMCVYVVGEIIVRLLFSGRR